jgi:hypothetical protein
MHRDNFNIILLSHPVPESVQGRMPVIASTAPGVMDRLIFKKDSVFCSKAIRERQTGTTHEYDTIFPSENKEVGYKL